MQVYDPDSDCTGLQIFLFNNPQLFSHFDWFLPMI